MTQPIVVAEDLTRAFTPDAGVFDLNLEMDSGQILGLIGPSGSGKTTTVRLMIGVMRPDSGSVRVFNEDPTDFDTKTRARIGYMPQEFILYPELTLAENLEFSAALYGMGRGRTKVIDRLTEELDINKALDRTPTQASGGEKRRVMLAATLLHDPDLLFLDEPTAGIDPVLRRKVWDRLSELAEGDRTLIVTTQYVGEAAYCDYVAVLAEGRVLVVDTPEGLRRKAFGGELMDVVFATRPTMNELKLLKQAVNGQELEWLDGRSLRLIVDDAGEAGPKISNWSTESNVELLEAESHIPPFDDVFVNLVEKLGDESNRSDEAQPDEEDESVR